MKKILANDGISPAGKSRLEAAGYEVITEKVAQEALANAINEQGYVAVLVRSATKVRQDVIDTCPGLKLIGRGGVGMDNIDVDYARNQGLHVINTPAASSQSVAELVMGHLFNLSRSLYDANRQMPANGNSEFGKLKKKYAKGVELRGKKLGIVGFGRIGQALATYAIGIGMEVLAHDRSTLESTLDLHIQGVGTVKVPLRTASMEEVLKESDFISLHVPAMPGGKALIGADELALMKDGVGLINAARGGVIDEDALLEALNSGKVAYAGLDVFVNEPTPRADVLAHEKVSLTPHIGAATVEAQDRIGVELADRIIELLG
ncbi:MAG: D-2-hydroxyacid dehydrogenase [Salibacteraceae bacterium]